MAPSSRRSVLSLFVALSAMVSGRAAGPADPEPSLDFFARPLHPAAPAFTHLPLGELRPAGWLRRVMEQDLAQGFVGQLDRLVPQIFADDLFGAARRMSPTQVPPAGMPALTGAEWEISMQWWNGETQGNWWDGFMRTAFLTDDRAGMAKAAAFVRHILATQDADGYLGIYGPAMRYQHPADNGELWCQTLLFRTLLGYYEYTGDPAVLTAVVRAMDVTMARYGEGGVSPFAVRNEFGGVSHGLMLTDVCETLARLTGDAKYTRYAVYLYREFSRHPINPQYNDLRYAHLADPNRRFIGHAAHTFEHFRSLLLASHATGYPELRRAYANALHLLDSCLLPGGAGFGDEWLSGKTADPDRTAAEYCGMLELRNFYASALQKSGAAEFGDRAETLTFNSMQGARSADGKALTYCKTDNCHILDKKSPHSGFLEADPRYKYSPTHQDAAVCCNPNYGRNLPYYVGNMWMKAEDGLAAVLYGPVTLTTRFAGETLRIREETNYPFSDEIDFIFETGAAAELSIHLRKPGWAKAVSATAPGATVNDRGEYLVVRKAWRAGDRIRLSFQNEIQPVPQANGETALRRGPLVYALPIASRTETIRVYALGGFTDYLVFPADETIRTLTLDAAQPASHHGFTFVAAPPGSAPWYGPVPRLSGAMVDRKTGRPAEVSLVPMGTTVLRRVTFPTK